MVDDGRLVHYSLSLAEDAEHLIGQFHHSVATLRRHNERMPVVLFFYGDMPTELAWVCHRFGVMVHEQGSYEARLRELCPSGSDVLALYPALHKFLNWHALDQVKLQQVLYCDCDTVFFDDVARLFDAYATPELVAREEVHTSRSPHGADPAFLDEELLARLVAAEPGTWIPPFNSGVVLMNHGLWRRAARLEHMFLDVVWRFVVGMSLHPLAPGSPFADLEGMEHVRRRASLRDRERALPFPSPNRWLLEEVAQWVTLSTMPGLRCGDFSPADVVQNGEFAASDPASAAWTVCHYYSGNQDSVSAWLNGSLTAIS